ncbi:hypothetical protein ACFV4Q_02720 [Streptomyces nojiriensis]|uniref:hypothetical protein n=1 Tax=Streptomyces nojiriensis TaxID=66374 RepID=UPI0036648286
MSDWASRPQPTTDAAQDRELDDLSNLPVEHAPAGRQISHLLTAVHRLRAAADRP